MKTFPGFEPSKSLEAICALPLGPVEMQPRTLGRSLSIRVGGRLRFPAVFFVLFESLKSGTCIPF